MKYTPVKVTSIVIIGGYGGSTSKEACAGGSGSGMPGRPAQGMTISTTRDGDAVIALLKVETTDNQDVTSVLINSTLSSKEILALPHNFITYLVS